ncbi:hypothetical protein HYX10_06210 [Candidatus Woesearchaeota archaeon]|nr:hypothetical protein [Candidatus Woesearchaeota archaeon]
MHRDELFEALKERAVGRAAGGNPFCFYRNTFVYMGREYRDELWLFPDRSYSRFSDLPEGAELPSERESQCFTAENLARTIQEIRSRNEEELPPHLALEEITAALEEALAKQSLPA